MTEEVDGLIPFQYEDMEFSKDGSLDELIALDRYVIPAYEGYQGGDTVVAIIDDKGTKRVGEVIGLSDGIAHVKDRLGELHDIDTSMLHKPLETRPSQLWTRWAKGAASVEAQPLQLQMENELRWLFDGYRYSLGGRIQVSLGQEFVTGTKANLTAYNCYVARSPKTIIDNPCAQFLDVIEVAYKEASIMRRGGGVGINISTIATSKGSGATPNDFVFYLDELHPDYQELLDRQLLGKFDGVTVVTNHQDFLNLQHAHRGKIDVSMAMDSVDGMFLGNIKGMVTNSYKGKAVFIDFNDLRKRYAIVHGVNGRSSGAVSWMELFVLVARLLQQKEIDNVDFAEIFSSIVHLIQQGGSRRGALMLINEVTNKSVEKFITRKKTSGFLSGANVSVGINEEFMTRVKLAKSGEYDRLRFPEVAQAEDIWDTIIESAWASAEPGIVWLERYNKESNSWYFSPIIATNPCGEQGLPAWGVCNLGHHVLPHYFFKGGKLERVSNPHDELFYPKWQELNGYNINWDDLARACRTAVRLQDNIIDYTIYFLEENKELQMRERRVGIGSMGLGTLMIRMELRYGSDKGNEFADILYKFIAYHTYKASILLAKEKGAFPAFEYAKAKESGFMIRLLGEFPDLDELLFKFGIRNVTLLTQAPTGSTATYIDNIPLFVLLFGGASTGVEPYYAFEFYRASRLGEGFMQTMAIAKQYMDEHEIENIEDLPEWFVTAMDLQPRDHVMVQAAVQRWTDSSISKTANCPNDYTPEQTAELYMLAYDMGLKGMTIYRDGSRQAQVLSTEKEGAKLEAHIEAEQLAELKKDENKIPEVAKDLFVTNEEKLEQVKEEIAKRPSRLFGFTEKVKFTSGDKMAKAYITVNIDEEGEPAEIFITTNDVSLSEFADSIGRLATQFLRFAKTQNNVDQLVKHLRAGKPMSSLSSKVASLIEQTSLGKIKVPTPRKTKKKPTFQKCPSCGEVAYDKANCICTSCGTSHCN